MNNVVINNAPNTPNLNRQLLPTHTTVLPIALVTDPNQAIGSQAQFDLYQSEKNPGLLSADLPRIPPSASYARL
jgi:hypothetical protein